VDEITIEHLLTHTSGGWPNNGTDPMFYNKRANHAELIASALTQPLRSPPGHAFAYSNFGYCVLGRVIEKIVRQPYADFVRDRVLMRCGISDMTISGNTLGERRSGEVKYYGQNGEDPYGTNVTRMDSCGGWIASPADLARFAMHVSGFPKPGNILKSETIATMTTATAQNANYAKGWEVNEVKTWWHEGSLPGSNAIMVRTNAGFCWAAGANSRDKNVMNFLMRHDFLRLLRTMVGQVDAWHA
jgi:CubicO group peptidase (beta-lactamase class C family)